MCAVNILYLIVGNSILLKAHHINCLIGIFFRILIIFFISSSHVIFNKSIRRVSSEKHFSIAKTDSLIIQLIFHLSVMPDLEFGKAKLFVN